MPATPRITVIIPNLNQARFLERAICSVLDQGYRNLETIIVDGGSADGSLDVIRFYEADITCWRSGPYACPAAAINWALERATGRIIMVVDSDSLLMPHALREVARQMGDDDGPLWLAGRTVKIDEFDRPIGEVTPSAPRGFDRWLMHESGVLPNASMALHRELLAAHGHFDEGMKIAYGYEMTTRLLGAGLQPTLAPLDIAAVRDQDTRTVEDTLREGLELIEVASRSANLLAPTRRRALWRNLDERRQIYALAEAEVRLSDAKRYLWRQLLRHPWWLRSDHYRHALLTGSAATITIPAQHMPRPQAA